MDIKLLEEPLLQFGKGEYSNHSIFRLDISC